MINFSDDTCPTSFCTENRMPGVVFESCRALVTSKKRPHRRVGVRGLKKKRPEKVCTQAIGQNRISISMPHAAERRHMVEKLSSGDLRHINEKCCENSIVAMARAPRICQRKGR